MAKLYIVGDSFGTAAGQANWCDMLADRMDLELCNYCLDGVSQDYAFRILIRASTEITKQDRVIVLLTSANRFWFQEQHPQVTNPALESWSQYLDPSVGRAAEQYVRYLQRPELDIQWTVQRLGWLSSWQQRAGWQRPLIICCWPQHLHQALDYQELEWAQGDLVTVSRGELAAGTQLPAFDPRYNHLCMTNHRILCDKISRLWQHSESLRLDEGFAQQQLSEHSLRDPDFCHKELDQAKLKLAHNQRFYKT